MRVSSPTSRLDIRPGARGELPVEVVNTGTVIDGITARVIGLPERSVTSSPAMLPLFPDAAGHITLMIALPATFPAGDHPLTVEVTSRQADTPTEYVNVDVTVPRAPAVELTSRPEMVRARRTGRFILTVTNRGNTALDVNLTAVDPQRTCAVTVLPPTAQLAPGESAESVVTVRGRRLWMGTESDRSLRATASARAVASLNRPRYDGDLGLAPDAPEAGPVSAADTVPAAPNPLAAPGLSREADGSAADAAVDTATVAPPAAEPIEASVPLTFRQRPYLTRGLLTALILIAIVAMWAAVFLFGLNKVFAGDPLTKQAPASFFAATPAAAGVADAADTATDGAAGAASAGTAGSTAGAGTAGASGASGAAAAAPAGALAKSGTLPPGVGGAIGGTVTAASSGEPVPRILVTALRVKADGTTVDAASAATQADGTYQVTGLFPGPYVLRFDAPGFRTTYYPTSPNETDAKQLSVSTGAVTSGANATVIGLPASVTGTVDFGDTTEPITATVSARLLGKSSTKATVIPDTKTAANGTYTFKNLPAPGTYALTITADGYEIATAQTTVTGGANRFVSATVLTAGAAQISGTVTDGTAPLGGATVSVTVDGQQLTTGTPTVGQVGHFVIGSLPTPATYILTASKDGYGQVSQVIDLGPSGQQGDLTIALTAGTGVVTGTVTAPDGTPIGGATIVAGGLADPPQTTSLTSGAIGTFRLEGLPVPGSYTLTVTAPGYADQTVPVTLAADTVAAPITAQMAPSMGVITGRVLGKGGAGIAGATVTVTDGQKSWPTTTASSGSGAGSFAVVGLPTGRYTVTATVLDAGGNPLSQTTLASVTAGKSASVTFRMGG